MEQNKITRAQWISYLIEAAKTLTPEQILAVSWVMGGSGVGWTKMGIIDALRKDLVTEEKFDRQFTEWNGNSDGTVGCD